MATILQPTITEAGLNAIWLKTKDGLSAQITHIAVGDGAYNPTQSMTKLKAEKARYKIADSTQVSSRQIHLSVLADGPKEFWIREVGFILADGTLFALWSTPASPLAYKSANVDILLSYDLELSSVPAGSITVQSTSAGLNLVLAEEIAALGTAAISNMLRHTQLKDDTDALAQQVALAELQHASKIDSLMSTLAANATATINLQNLFAKTHP